MGTSTDHHGCLHPTDLSANHLRDFPGTSHWLLCSVQLGAAHSLVISRKDKRLCSLIGWDGNCGRGHFLSGGVGNNHNSRPGVLLSLLYGLDLFHLLGE